MCERPKCCGGDKLREGGWEKFRMGVVGLPWGEGEGDDHAE